MIQRVKIHHSRTDDNIIRHTLTARWITKVTDTHSEYVTNCCFSTTMATRTYLNVTFIPTLPAFFISAVDSSKTVTIECWLEGGIQNGHRSYSEQHNDESNQQQRKCI